MLCALGHEWQLGCAKYLPNGKLLHIFRVLFLFSGMWCLISILLHHCLLLWQNVKSKKISVSRFANFMKFEIKTFWHFEDIEQQNKSIANSKKIIPRSNFCRFNFCCIIWNHFRASYHLSKLSSKNKKKEPLPQIDQV